MLQLGSLNKLEQQVPQVVAMSSLADLAGPAPRKQLVLRAIDEAFLLDDPAAFPRSRKAFVERLESGQRRLPTVLAELSKLAVEIGSELDKTRAELRALTGKPGAPARPSTTCASSSSTWCRRGSCSGRRASG